MNYRSFFGLLLLSFLSCCNSPTTEPQYRKPDDKYNSSANDNSRKLISLDDGFISYIVDPKKLDINLYWKNDQQQNIKSLGSLKDWLEHKNKKLLFAMNAGMYKEDYTPVGLFIENRKIITPLNKRNASGNFYWKPNGVFYITTKNLPIICKTEDFVNDGNIKLATQSGPMLLINGQIHPAFTKASTSGYIRNGVGILPNNEVIFAMSKTEINFYDFANYFKNKGCKNALYFDGFVSRTYLPEQNWIQTDGDFGVIVGVALDP